MNAVLNFGLFLGKLSLSFLTLWPIKSHKFLSPMSKSIVATKATEVASDTVIQAFTPPPQQGRW